jgi:hypothetical protein
VLRSAAVTTSGPKLKRTSFSFVRPKISAETLKTDISNAQISESLVETNRILVEIQKQLAFDFAMRIAEEKEAIKKIKTAESKRKFAEKEKSVEETKKIGGALGGGMGMGGGNFLGEFLLKGSDLILATQRANNNLNIRRGN